MNQLVSLILFVLALPITTPALLLCWATAGIARRRFARVAAAQEALQHLGLAGEVVLVRLACGGRSGAVAFVTLADGRRLVLKKALPYGSIMALYARIMGPMPYLGVAPAERMRREAGAMAHLASEGVAVPRLLAVDEGTGLIAMECVDGVCLADRAADAAVAARFGRAIAAVHRAGVALCDGHPGNAILEPDGRVVVIDLEWAATGAAAWARRGFDLAYASAFFPCPASRAAFFQGYGRLTSAVRAQVERARGDLAPFAWLLRAERVAA